MNNKEFTSVLAQSTGNTIVQTQKMVNIVLDIISEALENDNMVSISGFGTFEVKKKMERIVINPTTRQRMLVPPKLVVSFKSTNGLKEKVQE